MLMEISWKTLFLPNNFPSGQVLRNYGFGYNETHTGLVLDYGSLLNHHESPNVEVGEEFPKSNKVHFQVRMSFEYFHCNAVTMCGIHVCTHTYTTETRTHDALSRSQKT